MELKINFWTEKHIDDVIEMLEQANDLEQAIRAYKEVKQKLFKQ